ncbi:MAG: hypothetical protein JWP02_1665 [Acidimicrobiales bacterium]|nr:hypothetical protein [Acidimicrobiales bacterium]
MFLLSLARRGAGPLLKEPARGTPTITMVSTAFAVLLAFITIAAFQTYNGAKAGARAEAVALLEMYRTAALFSPQDRDAMRADFICYGRSVATDEWAAMRQGRRSPLTEHWIAAYRDVFDRVDVSSPRGQVALQEMLAEARNRTDARRERLTEDTPSVPLPLWLVLGLGGAVAVVLQLAMADRRERFIVQATMITGVASIVAAGLLLVNFLDHPYAQHIGGIKPVEMRQTLQMMRQTSPTLALPCDVAGQPRRT